MFAAIDFSASLESIRDDGAAMMGQLFGAFLAIGLVILMGKMIFRVLRDEVSYPTKEGGARFDHPGDAPSAHYIHRSRRHWGDAGYSNRSARKHGKHM